MAVPNWFFPPTGTQNVTARGVALVPYSTGLLVADWTTPRVFPFIGGFLESPITIAAGYPGISDAATDSSNGVWLAGYTNSLWHLTSGGAITSGALPSGQVYVGVSPSGHVLSSSGIIYTSAGVQLGAFPTAAIGSLTSSGTVMQAILPASGIGLMTSTGVTGHIGFPVTNAAISCIAASAGVSLAAAGWVPVPALSGVAAAGLDPAPGQNNEIMLAVGSGSALIWQTALPFSESWAQTQSITGTANLNSMCWAPDGIQALATSVVSGAVQVLNYSASVLSLAQTLTIAGACSVAVAGSSANALVAQSGLSQLAALSAIGGVWSSGSPVTGLAGITTVIPFGATGAVAAFSGGLAYVGLNGSAWTVQQTLSVGFVPTALAIDPFLQIYAAGSGHVAVCSGLALIGAGTFAGAAPTSLAIQQGRLIAAVPGSGLAIFGNTAPGVWSQQGSQSGAVTGLALSSTVLFAMGSGATSTFGFSGAPYALTPVVSGVLGLWNGSSWSAAVLGIGHNPSAVGFDLSGNVWLTTVQNTLWQFTSTGGVISSGIVPQPVINGSPIQPQTVPLGPSAIQVTSGGSVFVATSLSGVLIQVA